MSIQIRKDLCTGCGACVSACPGSLFNLKDNKVVLRRPEDCWGCTACLKACAFGAIYTFLGADIGGKGTELSISREGTKLHWTFVKPNGGKHSITVDARNANRY